MDNTKTVRFFNPAKGYLAHKAEYDEAISRVLTNGDLILRKDVEDFERKLAEYVGTKYAVALNSGTDALYLALKAVGADKESFVSVPSHTFVATAQVVAQIGATPDLFDLGEKPGTPGPWDIFMVAHIAGELSPLPKTQMPIIEDACQALGAVKNPTSDVQCWSFYPAKILGCFGDGGALTTNRKDIYDYVVEARNHFKTNYDQWGINSRMDNLQAAVLNVKFKYIDQILARRKEIAEKYDKELGFLDGDLDKFDLPKHSDGRVWQDYVLRANDADQRDRLYDFLKLHGIETMKNEYPFPIKKGEKSLKYEAETLRLPCNENLTDDEIKYVVDTIKAFYGQ